MSMFRRGITFKATYRAYSLATLNNSVRKREIERGNKILLPASALSRLTALEARYPMMFKISNEKWDRSTHCGVLEFSADPFRCNLPLWLMRFLLLDEGDNVQLQTAELPLGQFVKFQPQSIDFLEISDPKAVLERILGNFACLSTNDMLDIHYNEQRYQVLVLETKPDAAIRIIDCDLKVDFAPPLGYKEPERQPKKAKDDFEQPVLVEDCKDRKVDIFGGIGSRVDGKPIKTILPAKKTIILPKRGVPDRKWRLGRIKMIRMQPKQDQTKTGEEERGVKLGRSRTELE